MALSAGSIAFTSFSADGNDNLAFVALETIAAGTTIYFTDRTWNGTAFTSAESVWSWTAGADVAAGTVVTLDNVGFGSMTTNVGTATFLDTTNRGLSATAETVYAYLGTDGNTPTTFLTAIASRNFTDNGVLTGTGLTEGTNALNLNDNGGIDVGAFDGARNDQTSYADYRARINDAANWITQDGTGDQSIDGTGPDVPFSTTTFTVCFASDTCIATPAGATRVQDLRAGDRVLTVTDHGHVVAPVRWVGHRTLNLRAHPAPHVVAPITIPRDALGDGVPSRDLVVSPDHALVIDGGLIPARRLVNGMTITQDLARASVTYHHVELDRHAILLAEGAPAESYLDTGNRGFFANADAPMALHPMPAPTRSELSCLTLIEDDAAIEPIWRRIYDRSIALGHVAPEAATTTDPDLSIVLDGQRLRPVASEGDTHTFVLPPGTTQLRILSRAARLTDSAPWREDRRQLGVRLARIACGVGDDLTDIPLDHPGLGDGWWAIERDGSVLRRWTNGDATLSLPPVPGPVTLRLTLSDRIAYPVTLAPRAAA